MAGNYKMTYNVDLVFCIDATGSMEQFIDTVRNNALNLYGDIVNTMKAKNKVIENIRVRVIAFRDYLADPDPMMCSDFFQLPEQAEELKECLACIEAIGGGDVPEDALEALAYAIRSPWNRQGIKKRHVIALWTDAPSHEIGYGKESPNYPNGMASSYEELSKWWGDLQNGGYMDQQAKRLAMFAPLWEEPSKENPSVWQKIAREWDQAIISAADSDTGLRSINYETIVAQICNTI